MIRIIDIKKNYGKKVVLQEVSFEAKGGEIIAIAGKNGSGKSTLLQILAGVQKADAGQIFYFGKNAGTNRRLFQKYCGYVPQDNPLLEELTVRENLLLFGTGNKKLEDQVIESLDLLEIMKQPVETLSGGMKRRVSIAAAMLSMPPVLLLDEPTTGLDLFYKKSIEELLDNYKENNGLVIMATHDEKEILHADRCMLMQNGVLSVVQKKEGMIEQICHNIMK